MKKFFLLFTLFLLTMGFNNASAQGGGVRKTVEERVSDVMAKLTDFNLDKAKNTETQTVITDFYKAHDKMREELMAGGGMPDRDAI